MPVVVSQAMKSRIDPAHCTVAQVLSWLPVLCVAIGIPNSSAKSAIRFVSMKPPHVNGADGLHRIDRTQAAG